MFFLNHRDESKTEDKGERRREKRKKKGMHYTQTEREAGQRWNKNNPFTLSFCGVFWLLKYPLFFSFFIYYSCFPHQRSEDDYTIFILHPSRRVNKIMLQRWDSLVLMKGDHQTQPLHLPQQSRTRSDALETVMNNQSGRTEADVILLRVMHVKGPVAYFDHTATGLITG